MSKAGLIVGVGALGALGVGLYFVVSGLQKSGVDLNPVDWGKNLGSWLQDLFKSSGSSGGQASGPTYIQVPNPSGQGTVTIDNSGSQGSPNVLPNGVVVYLKPGQNITDTPEYKALVASKNSSSGSGSVPGPNLNVSSPSTGGTKAGGMTFPTGTSLDVIEAFNLSGIKASQQAAQQAANVAALNKAAQNAGQTGKYVSGLWIPNPTRS